MGRGEQGEGLGDYRLLSARRRQFQAGKPGASVPPAVPSSLSGLTSPLSIGSIRQPTHERTHQG